MSTPKISVVVPTYFRNDYLREALESVAAQTYPETETVVVDDSGEVHAEPVVAEFDDIRYIPLEENSGAQHARNVGIRETTGEYVQLLDDDDALQPTKLERQRSLLERRPEVGVAYCGVEWTDGHIDRPDPDARGDVLARALAFSMHPCSTSTMLVRRSELDAVTPLKPLSGADDVDTIIRLAERTDFDFIDEPLVRRHNFADSRGADLSEGALQGRKQILEDYRELYEQYPAAVRKEALTSIYRREGKLRLERHHWSARAILAFARLNYHSPEVRPHQVGLLLGSLLGRPGVTAARALYRRLGG